MDKKHLIKHFKTPLAVVIGAALFNMAHASDWTFPEGEYEEEIVIDDSASWNGDFILSAENNISLEMNYGSKLEGNVINDGPTSYDDMPSFHASLMDQSKWEGDISGTMHAGIDLDRSEFKGNVSIEGEFHVEAYRGKYTGDISLTGYSDQMSDLSMNLANNSSWQGNATGDYMGMYAYLTHNSLWEGNASGNNLSFNSSVHDNSVWRGNVTNFVDDDNACGCANIDVEGFSQWYGDSTIHLDGTNGVTAHQNIYVSDSSLWEGNTNIVADSADWNMDNSIYISQNSVWKGNATVSGDVISMIHLNDNSVWQGDLVLNNYAVESGSPGFITSDIGLYGSSWIGHVVSDDAYTDVSLADESHWTMTGNSKLNMLDINDNSSVTFASLDSSARDYHTLTVQDLVGDGHFTMRAGYYGPGDYSNDKLIITGDKTVSGFDVSDSLLTVLNNGSDNTHGTDVITMVETVDGLDQFTLTSDVELGGYVYTLSQDGTNWVLRPGEKGSTWEPAPVNPPDPDPTNPDPTNPDPGTPGNPGGNPGPTLSSTADAAANMANVNYLLNYVETQTLYQRMGELRNSHSQGGVWLRGYHGGVDKNAGGLLRSFDMSYQGMQLGVDKQFDLNDGRFYFGAVTGITDSSQDYRNGKGTAKNYQGGVYGTYIASNGFFIDGLMKYNHMKNEFNVTDTAGRNVNGQAKSDGLSVSVETGKRFHFNEAKSGFYLEPQAQLTFAWQDGSHYHASNGLKVDIDSHTSLQGRVGTLVGYEVNSGKTPVNFYIKTNYVKEFDGKTNYALNGSKQDHSFKGDWWNNGVGVSAQFNKQHNVYFDMEKSNGDSFNQHQVNVGYRFNF